MSLRSRKQQARVLARATRGSAVMAERAALTGAQARRAAAQFGPLARTASSTARQNAGQQMYVARVWAAPRLDRAGIAVTERAAPRLAAMLAATARRVEPMPPPRRRRRWPAILAGMIVLAAAGSAAAAFRMSRRTPAPLPDDMGMGMGTPEGARPDPGGSPDGTGSEPLDVNGRARSSRTS